MSSESSLQTSDLCWLNAAFNAFPWLSLHQLSLSCSHHLPGAKALCAFETLVLLKIGIKSHCIVFNDAITLHVCWGRTNNSSLSSSSFVWLQIDSIKREIRERPKQVSTDPPSLLVPQEVTVNFNWRYAVTIGAAAVPGVCCCTHRTWIISLSIVRQCSSVKEKRSWPTALQGKLISAEVISVIQSLSKACDHKWALVRTWTGRMTDSLYSCKRSEHFLSYKSCA